MTGEHLDLENAGHGRRVVVLGATGQQGGAVVSALLTKGWCVRAVTREPSDPRARRLAASGAEVVAGDFTNHDSLHAAFSQAYGVFSVQPSSGQPTATVTDEQEIAFGKSVATIAQSEGVSHLVYSSAIAVGPVSTGIAHFDTKHQIEAHIRGLDVDSTIIRPATFMEMLPLPHEGVAGLEVWFLMADDQPMQFIAVRDIGLIVADIFATPRTYVGATLDIAGDELTGSQLAHQLSVAVGETVAYHRVSPDDLAADPLLMKLAAAVDDGILAGRADIALLRMTFPFLLDYQHWLTGPPRALARQ